MKRGLVFLWLVLFCIIPGYAQDNVVPITPENASNLMPLWTIGKGALLDLIVIENGARLLALSTGGITDYDADLNERQFIPFAENYIGDFRYGALDGSGRLTYADGIATAVLPARGSQPPTIIAVDLESGTQSILPAADTDVLKMVSPDGRWVVSASLPEARTIFVQIADSTTGTIRDLIPVQDGRLALRVLPDNTLVTLAARSGINTAAIQLWDMESGVVLAEAAIPDSWPPATITETHIFVESWIDQALVIYSLPDLEEVSRIPDAALIGANATRLIYRYPQELGVNYFYDVATNTQSGSFSRPECSGGCEIVFGTGRFYCYYPNWDGFIAGYDLDTGERLALAGDFGRFVTDMAAFGDGRVAVAGGAISQEPCYAEYPGNGVAVYEVGSGQTVRFLPSTNGIATLVVTHAPSNIIAMARTGGVDVYRDDLLLASIDDENVGVYADGLALSGDGKYLALAYANSAYVWDTEKLDADPIMVGHYPWRFIRVSNIHFWGQTLIYIGEMGTDMMLLDVTTGAKAMLPHYNAVHAFAVAGDTLVVKTNYDSGEDSSWLYVYHLGANGAELINDFGVPSALDRLTMELSPDGRLIVLSELGAEDLSGSGTVILETATGKMVKEIGRASQPLVFTPDGGLLIGADGAIPTVYGIKAP